MKNHSCRANHGFSDSKFFSPAYFKTVNIGNVIEGFKVCGISPFNNDLFSDTDFVASDVTEKAY